MKHDTTATRTSTPTYSELDPQVRSENRTRGVGSYMSDDCGRKWTRGTGMKFKCRRRGMQRTQRLNTIGCMLLSSSTEQQNFIEGTDLLTTVDSKIDRQVNFSNHKFGTEIQPQFSSGQKLVFNRKAYVLAPEQQANSSHRLHLRNVFPLLGSGSPIRDAS